MRVTYCPRGHRVVVPPDLTKFDAMDYAIANHLCSYCVKLVFQQKPFKAKRSGES